MTITVLPANAVNPTVVWSVAGGTGSTTIDVSRLLIAVADGTVTITTTAAGGSGVSGSVLVTISRQQYYTVTISGAAGGSVCTDRMSAYAGETVTLTVMPNAGYVLMSLNVLYNNGRDAVGTQGTCATRTFTMHAANVTVTAYFVNPMYQAAWDAAKALIEAADFSLTQLEAPNETAARYRLADIINELIKETGFTISPNDIVIFLYNFRPALAGDSDNPSGTNGYFEFRVTPPNTRVSAYNEGAITATSYDDVANEQLRGTGQESPVPFL